MRKTAVYLAASLFISFAFYSCSKSTGSTGPAGPAGTANVLYSTWGSLRMTYNSTDSAYEQTIAADSVTQSVLDSGLVLCYIKYTNQANQLQVESADTYMEIVLGLHTINLYSSQYDYTGTSFRYLIIHGGASVNGRLVNGSSTIRGFTKEEWKAMPYEKVLSILGSQ